MIKSFFSLFSRWQFLGVTFLTASLIVTFGLGIQLVLQNSPQSPSAVNTATLAPSIPLNTLSKPPAVTSPRPSLQPSRPLVFHSRSLPPFSQRKLGSGDLDSRNSLRTAASSLVTPHLGHLPYPESDRQRLVQVSTYYDRAEFLDSEAAEAFKRMKADAQTHRVEIVLISGFRSVATQEKLFQKQIQRRGSLEAAARLSAPPGYSEHHTGYALDVGDGERTDSDLKYEFESTNAYRWLASHGYRYGFELSFPRNNSQRVNFEPWHWRYLGSPRAIQTFAAARSFSQSAKSMLLSQSQTISANDVEMPY